MNKIMFIGDVHASSRTPASRIDDYSKTFLTKLESLRDLALKENADTIITTGDFFDAYHEPVSYLNRLMEVLSTFADNNITILSLIGNHDLPYNNMDYFNTTPLSLLFKSRLVKRLDKIETKHADIYGIHFTQRDILDSFELDESKTNILVMHYAIDNTVPNESINAKALSKFDIVVSGHDHMYYHPISIRDKTVIIRPGSFTRLTKDKYNLDRDISIYSYELDTKDFHELKLPNVLPAEKVFKNEVFSEQPMNLYSNNLNDLFDDKTFNYDEYDLLKILSILPPTVTKESKERIKAFLKQRGALKNNEDD